MNLHQMPRSESPAETKAQHVIRQLHEVLRDAMHDMNYERSVYVLRFGFNFISAEISGKRAL